MLKEHTCIISGYVR